MEHNSSKDNNIINNSTDGYATVQYGDEDNDDTLCKCIIIPEYRKWNFWQFIYINSAIY